MLAAMDEDGVAKTPQQALNFLSRFWNNNKDGKVNFSEKFKDITLKKQPADDLQLQINQYQEEMNTLGTGRLALQRKTWIKNKIYELESQIRQNEKI